MMPIWATLIQAHQGHGFPERSLARAIAALAEARRDGPNDETYTLADALRQWPEHEVIRGLNSLHPEQRVQSFDHLVEELQRSQTSGDRSEALAFIAAYVAATAAGGAPSVGLAEGISDRFPAVLAWTYVIMGIGQRSTWSSAFEGLGRLVSRELSRPLHLDEAPTCDFALDEAVVVMDRQLSDPLVHLRIKQQRHISVALLPGVNLTLPLSEATPARPVVEPRVEAKSETSMLVEMLWPSIRERIISEGLSPQSSSRPQNVRKPRGGQGKLSW
jgi:hypothetical protein